MSQFTAEADASGELGALCDVAPTAAPLGLAGLYRREAGVVAPPRFPSPWPCLAPRRCLGGSPGPGKQKVASLEKLLATHGSGVDRGYGMLSWASVSCIGRVDVMASSSPWSLATKDNIVAGVTRMIYLRACHDLHRTHYCPTSRRGAQNGGSRHGRGRTRASHGRGGAWLWEVRDSRETVGQRREPRLVFTKVSAHMAPCTRVFKDTRDTTGSTGVCVSWPHAQAPPRVLKTGRVSRDASSRHLPLRRTRHGSFCQNRLGSQRRAAGLAFWGYRVLRSCGLALSFYT